MVHLIRDLGKTVKGMDSEFIKTSMETCMRGIGRMVILVVTARIDMRKAVCMRENG
jgi:hypothetical protein